jgi:UDP-glucuronate 4-epimerase
MQPGDVPITCADISKAQKVLGYSPQTPFEEGIRKFVQWYATELRPLGSGARE